jgi:CubicO group peptidase (beta-lactamase class C family)
MRTSPLLSSTAQSTIRQAIDTTTVGPTPAIPGVVYCAVNRDGDLIFKHASGSTGLGLDEPMTLDTTFWIASCTKMITGIACMQLVEQGKLDLDDVDQVERIAPELKEVKVLQRDAQGRFVLVPKERAITLRMLLNHTGTVFLERENCLG